MDKELMLFKAWISYYKKTCYTLMDLRGKDNTHLLYFINMLFRDCLQYPDEVTENMRNYPEITCHPLYKDFSVFERNIQKDILLLVSELLEGTLEGSFVKSLEEMINYI